MISFLSPTPIPLHTSPTPTHTPVCMRTGKLPPYKIHHPPILPPLPHTLSSPLLPRRPLETFTHPDTFIVRQIEHVHPNLPHDCVDAFIAAGPRQHIHFCAGVQAAIVSCGGICPGINSVIRELTLTLYQYGATHVYGIENGYRGFGKDDWTVLTESHVQLIHKAGGSILGSSRGGFDVGVIVDAIEKRDVDMVFVIGGDGTIMGCQKVFREVSKRGLRTAVVSVPKTIDNDIPIIDKSFGFETAVDEAQRAINAAYVEASSFPNCVAIVKLMGRNSGFIACDAALASREVDCCLIPEEKFKLRGTGGVLEYMSATLTRKSSFVLVVAEGAGHTEYNAHDIGRFILSETKTYFAETDMDISTKYLDPTYQIRAIPTTTHDNVLCILMAHAAVHGAFAGYTGFSAGPVNGKIAYLPLDMIAGRQKMLDTRLSTWQRLRMSTGQPNWQLE